MDMSMTPAHCRRSLTRETKGMIEHALHIGFTQPMHLFWGVRSLRDLYLPQLLEAWQKVHPAFRFTPVLSEPQDQDQWRGATGWVHEAVSSDYPDLSAYDLYMSGPPLMIKAARQTFLEHGLPQDRLFSDAFEYNSQSSNAA